MVGHASSEDSVLEKSDSEISDAERAEQAGLIAKEEPHPSPDSHGGGHGVCACVWCVCVCVCLCVCIYVCAHTCAV